MTRREYEVLHLTPGGPVYVFTQSALHYDLGDTSSSQDYDYLSFQSKVRRGIFGEREKNNMFCQIIIFSLTPLLRRWTMSVWS